MIDAKKGNIDFNHFKNFIEKTEGLGVKNACKKPKKEKIDVINGWILDFFAYRKSDDRFRENERFCDKSLEVQTIDELMGR